MAAVRAVRGLTRTVGFLVLVVLIAVGPPLIWIWIGSQVQGGTAPNASAIVTVIAGLVITYMFLGLIVASIAARSNTKQLERIRYAWNRSLRDERYEVRRSHPLEEAFVAAALLVGIAITVWFFLFGHPGVPVGM